MTGGPHRDLLEAILVCEHKESSLWCHQCGSLRAPDGEWLLPEYVADMIARSEEADRALAASYAHREAIEWFGRFAEGAGVCPLDRAILELSGATVAVLAVEGIVRIDSLTIALTERGRLELAHWQAVRASEAVCACDHDRGSHGASKPGACSECACSGFGEPHAGLGVF
jgi:hypothetical protein